MNFDSLFVWGDLSAGRTFRWPAEQREGAGGEGRSEERRSEERVPTWSPRQLDVVRESSRLHANGSKPRTMGGTHAREIALAPTMPVRLDIDTVRFSPSLRTLAGLVSEYTSRPPKPRRPEPE